MFNQVWTGFKRTLFYLIGINLFANVLSWSFESELAVILTDASIIPILLFLLHFVDKRPFHSLGLHWYSFAVWLFLGLSVGIVSYSIWTALFLVFEAKLPFTWNIFKSPWLDEQTWSHIASNADLFLLAPFLEETRSRGYLFQAWEGTVEGKWGKVLAFSVTSLLFALGHWHQGTVGIIRTGIAGLGYGVAYVKTRSLWLPIGMHVGWNFISSLDYSWEVISNARLHNPGVLETKVQSPISLFIEIAVLVLLLILPLRPFHQDKLLWERYVKPKPVSKANRSEGERI